MSVYLEAVAQARDRRADSEQAFRAAIQRAAQHHSLAQIAPYAGLAKSGVAYITKQGNKEES